MDDELKALLAELNAAAKAIRGGGESSGWIDRKGIVLFALGAVLSFGGSWTGMRVQIADVNGAVKTLAAKVKTVATSAAQTAGEVRRVDSDSIRRDENLAEQIRDTVRDHMQYQHGGKRALWPIAPPTPPLLGAAAQPALHADPTPPLLPIDGPPCCAGLPYALGGG